MASLTFMVEVYRVLVVRLSYVLKAASDVLRPNAPAVFERRWQCVPTQALNP